MTEQKPLTKQEEAELRETVKLAHSFPKRPGDFAPDCADNFASLFATLDAERAKVAAMGGAWDSFPGRSCDSLAWNAWINRMEAAHAAYRAAGEGPVQPDVVAKLREALRRVEDCTDSSHQFYRRVLSIAGQSGPGEGTVPT